jgi:5-methylcytosine-specific restriction endonuclease McrA
VSTSRTRAVTADQWGVPERDAQGRVVCRWCRGPVAPPRRTFCGDACVHEWKIRSSPWYVRREVLCGLNVVKAHREWRRAQPAVSDRKARKAWRAARPRWEADHIVPVADGGGECGLDNYRLLCRPCHVRVTVEWRAARVVSSRHDDDAPCGDPGSRVDSGGAQRAAARVTAAVIESIGSARDSA